MSSQYAERLASALSRNVSIERANDLAGLKGLSGEELANAMIKHVDELIFDIRRVMQLPDR
jgi:hypothetical protein